MPSRPLWLSQGIMSNRCAKIFTAHADHHRDWLLSNANLFWKPALHSMSDRDLLIETRYVVCHTDLD